MRGGLHEHAPAPAGAPGVVPSPVIGRLRGRRIPLVNRTVMVALLVGFVAFLGGYQVGRPTVVAPLAEPSPAASPLIQPATVTHVLRDAYARGTTSGWAVCVTDSSPRCWPLAHQPGGPAQPGSYVFRFCNQGVCLSQVTPDSLPWTPVTGSHLVLVARLASAAARALIFHWDEPGRVPPSVAVEGVDPDAAGTFYFDLGDLPAGRHLVIVSALLPSTVNLDGSYAEWTTYLAGLVVATPTS